MGPRAKLDWAFDQLAALENDLRRIHESEPFHISDDFDPERGCHVLHFRIREEAFPPRVGPLVGGVVHAARSALDQAIWSVACRSNDPAWLWTRRIYKKIAFPPIWGRDDLPGHTVMEFITEDAKAVLKRLQEHEGGDLAKALGDLDEFWNIDKHRVSHNGVAKLDLSHVRPVYLSPIAGDLVPRPTVDWLPLSEPVKDGAEIARVWFSSGVGPPQTQVKMQGEPAALVAFGGGPVALSIEQIARLLIHTDGALLMLGELPDEAPLSPAAAVRAERIARRAKKRASTEKG